MLGGLAIWRQGGGVTRRAVASWWRFLYEDTYIKSNYPQSGEAIAYLLCRLCYAFKHQANSEFTLYIFRYIYCFRCAFSTRFSNFLYANEGNQPTNYYELTPIYKCILLLMTLKIAIKNWRSGFKVFCCCFKLKASSENLIEKDTCFNLLFIKYVFYHREWFDENATSTHLSDNETGKTRVLLSEGSPNELSPSTKSSLFE